MNGRTIFAALLLCTSVLLATPDVKAQTPAKAPFNPAYSIQDVRVEYGYLGSTRTNGNAGVESSLLEITYTRLFWRHLAWKGGFRYAARGAGYGTLVGAPIALAFNSGTLTYEQSLAVAAGQSAHDVIWDSINGRPDRIGSDILSNLLVALFRRTELYAGVTPGFYLGEALHPETDPGSRFCMTADLGVALSLPIRRVAINITPAYHYAFTEHLLANGTAARHYFSITGGFSYLF